MLTSNPYPTRDFFLKDLDPYCIPKGHRPGGWLETHELAFNKIGVTSPDVEAAYGKATIAAITLHHVLTDWAVAIGHESFQKTLDYTSGGLRILVLKAADAPLLANVRPYLHGWDKILGQQSIKYRNHIVHPQLWTTAAKQDVIGKIEGDVYTEWTKDRLVSAAGIMHYSAILLNQIFWDVPFKNNVESQGIRTFPGHQFMPRQYSVVSDITNCLALFESKTPPYPKQSGRSTL